MAELSKDIDSKMTKCVEATRSEFASVRTGRATPALLDRLHVEAYGQAVPLKQVAGVSTPDARTLVISAYDKGVVGDIRKAIEKSDLGLTPNVDGTTIRLSIPPLNEERRKELVKVAHKYAEAAKVAVRHVRRDGLDTIKKLEKNHEISEDDQERLATDVQKATDGTISEIDQLLAAKEKEILTV